jgi:hypothetical protein
MYPRGARDGLTKRGEVNRVRSLVRRLLPWIFLRLSREAHVDDAGFVERAMDSMINFRLGEIVSPNTHSMASLQLGAYDCPMMHPGSVSHPSIKG